MCILSNSSLIHSQLYVKQKVSCVLFSDEEEAVAVKGECVSACSLVVRMC